MRIDFDASDDPAARAAMSRNADALTSLAADIRACTNAYKAPVKVKVQTTRRFRMVCGCCTTATIDNMRDMAYKNRGYNDRKELYGVAKNRNGRFRARIKLHGKEITLGSYDTAQEANAVAKEAKRKTFLEAQK